MTVFQVYANNRRPRTTIYRRCIRPRQFAILGAAALLMTACAVPAHMQVRSGVDPRNQDEDVRFRTLYYFRVVDKCFVIEKTKDHYNVKLDKSGKRVVTKGNHPFAIKTEGRYRVLSDSLYRFRMTGKANPLFSKVHFEAGTLKASEIDPFGANVELDENGRRFRFVSAEETARRAEQNTIYKELQKLDDLAEGLKDEKPNDSAATKAVKQAHRAGIQKRITALWNRLTVLDGGTVSNAGAMKNVKRPDVTIEQSPLDIAEELGDAAIKMGDAAKGFGEAAKEFGDAAEKFGGATGRASDTSNKPGGDTKNDQLACPSSAVTRRGYQVLGPEGFRTFNQDERLMLAMSISGKPLISALKDLSSRVLNERSSSPARLLTLVQERLKVSEAKRILDRLEDDPTTTPENITKQVKEAFSRKEPGK
ncbi:MAG: hypothetical protein HOM25_02195 [Rhodospirillaceae bacterium]|nr:hypothetical protein [Rhodospirillaceae bacterium]MBT5663887.1 hypothetical protein [Rhodospirillaceae bacterium]